ncbi:MAG: hypothetical protein QNK11_08540 [Legionella sp.]|nr:hypothetical protein [Legionella sp.]
MFAQAYESIKITYESWIYALTRVVMSQVRKAHQLETITEEDIESLLRETSDSDSEPEVSLPISCNMM